MSRKAEQMLADLAWFLISIAGTILFATAIIQDAVGYYQNGSQTRTASEFVEAISLIIFLSLLVFVLCKGGMLLVLGCNFQCLIHSPRRRRRSSKGKIAQSIDVVFKYYWYLLCVFTSCILIYNYLNDQEKIEMGNMYKIAWGYFLYWSLAMLTWKVGVELSRFIVSICSLSVMCIFCPMFSFRQLYDQILDRDYVFSENYSFDDDESYDPHPPDIYAGEFEPMSINYLSFSNRKHSIGEYLVDYKLFTSNVDNQNPDLIYIEDDSPLCVICLGEYTEGDELAILPCSSLHHYHKNCISQWIEESATCPLCKSSIPINENV